MYLLEGRFRKLCDLHECIMEWGGEIHSLLHGAQRVEGNLLVENEQNTRFR